ncbi:MAG: sigma 54-interacting transcriptional regulator [bacterium]
MSPEEIRDLRGDLSREEFAAAIGVTPLTVYRWELPTQEKESRRPQRRLQRRLLEFAGATSPGPTSPGSTSPGSTSPGSTSPGPTSPGSTSPGSTSPGPTSPGPANTQGLDAYAYIFDGRWSDAQAAVLNALGLPAERAMGMEAQIAQAMLKILWTNDLQGAWGLVAPLLQRPDLATWPVSVAIPLHTVAALLHASPDGRLFSPGRVNAHVAHAERFDLENHVEFRALLHIAEMWSAFHSGDAAHHDRLRRQNQEVFRSASSKVVRWMAWEVGSVAAYLSGCIVEAIRFYKELVEAARDEGLPVIEVRASGYLAWMMLSGAESVEDVDELLKRAHKTSLRHRLLPGWPTMLVLSAQAEVACRRSDLQRASEIIEDGLIEAQQCQWPPVEFAYTTMRLAYLRNEPLDGQRLEQRLGTYSGNHRAALMRVVTAFADGLGGLGRKDFLAASGAMRRAAEMEQEIGTFPVFETYSFALAYYTAVLGGDIDGARASLRRAERALERLPMFWSLAALRLFKSLHAALEGRVADAMQHAEASEAAFTKVGDQAQSLLAGRLRAICSAILGEDDAEARLKQSAAEMQAAGIAIPAPYQTDAIDALKARIRTHESLSLAATGGLSILSQATNRLSTRGISPAQVLDELVDLLRQWRGLTNHTSVWLDELPYTGKPTVLLHTTDEEPSEFIEFGDGAGRRFRVGVGGTISSDERLVLQMMVQMTSMALEVVTLRGLTNAVSRTVEDAVPDLPGFIAESKGSRELLAEIGRVAKSRANVLLLGESGVGKEMVAHAVYKLSTRSNRSFVTFNCAAVPRDLFEGQLFGYRKGAFTGATSNHSGVLRAADGGTLFLDEIGDLPLDLQPKLLRFLENGEVFPLGDTRPMRVDVRVIAATHRDLEAMIAAGTFREDLYYRLAVVPIHITSLRERREDIVPLAQHFMRNLRDAPPAFSADAAKALIEHAWPGNVRELRNVVERSLAYVQDRDVVHANDLKF